MSYGEAPELLGQFALTSREYMHYLYLPLRIERDAPLAVPKRLSFVWPLLRAVYEHPRDMERYRYVYITSRRGWASPGNNLNRPGWHCDGFGSDDINYVWSDSFGTEYAEHPFVDISPDHVRSLEQFAEQVDRSRVRVYPDGTLARLNPYVVHQVADCPPPGGSRSFVKVSLSNHKYNLAGNSHNYLIEYEWEMHDRALIRNDPAYAGGDFFAAAGGKS